LLSTKTREQLRDEVETLLELRPRFKAMFDNFDKIYAEHGDSEEVQNPFDNHYSQGLEDMYVSSVLDGVVASVSPQELSEWLRTRRIEASIQEAIVTSAKDLMEYLLKDQKGTVQ